jgi:hypothetical protein
MTRAEFVVGSALFLGAGLLYFVAATRIVPPQVDHDLEVQATGYGLVTRFEPLLLTDRDTIYYFAHPPLLHLWVGGSFLLQGELESLRFYDDVSQRARAARGDRPLVPTATE